MEHLLDDVLVMVMQYLEVPDLLACRLVSKRLGGLALHPSVWRHRRLSQDDPFLRTALCLAPCLNELRLDVSSDRQGMTYSSMLGGGRQNALFATTKCAVAVLRLTVCGGGALLAACVIRNQQALGRLRQLLFVRDRFGTDRDPDGAVVLFATTANTCGLETLVVPQGMYFSYFGQASLTMATPPAASLKSLSVGVRFDPFISFMLAGHAATLQVVELGEAVAPLQNAVPLLAGLPNLRKLECCLLPGLQALAACASLKEVCLYVNSKGQHNVQDAKEFLRTADQLRVVSLKYRGFVHRDIGRDLVLALAGGHAPSRVESLATDNDDLFAEHAYYPYLQPLLAALPSLPALRHLKLNAVLGGLLRGISRDTLLTLRTLRLLPLRRAHAPVCAHSYLHSDLVESLLADNPALQLHVHAAPHCKATDPCEWCDLGCHREVCDGLGGKPEREEEYIFMSSLSAHRWINISRWYVSSAAPSS